MGLGFREVFGFRGLGLQIDVPHVVCAEAQASLNRRPSPATPGNVAKGYPALNLSRHANFVRAAPMPSFAECFRSSDIFKSAWLQCMCDHLPYKPESLNPKRERFQCDILSQQGAGNLCSPVLGKKNFSTDDVVRGRGWELKFESKTRMALNTL